MGVVLALSAVFAWSVSRQDLWERALRTLAPGARKSIYPGATLAELVGEHLAVVGIATAAVVAVGILLGVWVTRPSGRDFRQVVDATIDFGQTFPPVAVLALAMPLLGLGLWPAVVALFLYGMFPVVSSTVAGIESVPRDVLDAAEGMGMGRWRVLFAIELPLAARVIMAGIRTSTIIAIGTATVAAAIGAGGLGSPIIGGIQVQNMAYVLEGAVAAAILAVLADALLAEVEALVTPRGTNRHLPTHQAG